MVALHLSPDLRFRGFELLFHAGLAVDPEMAGPVTVEGYGAPYRVM
jgi:hypothetical protein